MADYVKPAFKKSPCETCLTVLNPSECDNKKCVPWQRWFIAKWEAMRADLFAVKRESAPYSIKVGGYMYLHPDLVRDLRGERNELENRSEGKTSAV